MGASPPPAGQWVFPFDHRHPVPPRELADVLGGKGANLAEMTSVLGLPVPPGFTITTGACRARQPPVWPAGLDEEVESAVTALERRVGRRFGDPVDPLLLSVRSGARSSMPGMLDTVLDLGLTPAAVDGFAHHVGERCALDSLRRFVRMYSGVVLGLDPAPFERLEGAALERAGASGPARLPVAALQELVRGFLEELERASGAPLPEPRQQLRAAIDAVFESWDGPRARSYRDREGIAHHLGTAVNVQAMVFGNRDERSGTGVAFSRNPATGEPRPYGDFLVDAQGEDVVAGTAQTELLDGLQRRFPDVHAELVDILGRLEAHYRDLCDTEFTIESGRLWMLQMRVGKRSAAAAVRIAVDLVGQDGWSITREEALGRVRPEDLQQLERGSLDRAGEVIAVGLPASPGAATGSVYLSAASCIEAVDRGEHVLLVRSETSPDDVHGMQVAEGILTARGGLVSHAAVVARGWGIPAVVGVEALTIGDGVVTIGGLTVHEGDVLSIDGATGEVRAGAAGIAPAAQLPELEILLGWADDVSGTSSVTDGPADRLAAAHAALAG